MNFVVENIFKSKIRKGVDAKLLRYDINATNICTTQIDLREIIETHLFKGEKVNCNCVMINLEKDTQRYNNTLSEFKKISFSNFVHLKGTYWKDKVTMENDLTFIIEFLKQFNPKIDPIQIKINEFSEINDPNVFIQDGPLGCYCSHLRAMVFGYLNFEKYTIIVEDDISITNTENIEKYLKCIPDDWDIICVGASEKNISYCTPYYKFTDEFHSTHFYIINNKCMEILFEHMYPITDQVDVLIAELIHKLNIYNIPDTIYQKCISTNTQNNLHTIFNARYYNVLREQLSKINESCMFFANKLLPNNEVRNETIVSCLLYDILHSYITDSDSSKLDEKNQDDENHIKLNRLDDLDEYNELFMAMAYFVQCAKKAIDVPNVVRGLINNILSVLKKFTLHNTMDLQFGEIVKGYSYGSTSQTYILEKNKIIIKAYNDKLRWTTSNHNDSSIIFERELGMLKRNILCGPQLIDFDVEHKTLILSYCGESLYDNFALPDDWKNQIENVFLTLTKNNIFYPEFKIHNILVLDNKIRFIDYGLASQYEGVDNTCNQEKFIKLLTVLNDKFRNIKDKEKIRELYSIFVQNMKITNQ